MNDRVRQLSILLLAMALLLPACGGMLGQETAVQPGDPADSEGAGATESDVGSDSTGGDGAGDRSYLERAEAGEFEGSEVSIFTLWVQEQGELFEGTFTSFEERTGITIKHEGSDDFETLIVERVEDGNPPDVGIFSQPGLVRKFAEDDQLVDLQRFIDMEKVEKNFSPAWVDQAVFGGEMVGIFYRASVKSLVWYPHPEFKEAGYEVPETWDEMIDLMDQMVADGETPWCIGLENSDATGWVATDWMEEIMLRTAGPELYDRWALHDIPFNHESVQHSAGIMSDIWFNEDYVLGGRTAILNTDVTEAPHPMFDKDGPDCWLHRQAGWIASVFPDGVEAGKDARFFYLPPINDAHGRPVLGGGDMAAAFSERPEVLALMEYLATPEASRRWVEAGGFISPNQGVLLDWYPNQIERDQASILMNSTIVRFDASDQMPAEVGTGTFWDGMVDWVDGKEMNTVLQDIESSWPEE